MKSARHQFILAGLLSQGLAWDSPYYWLAAIGLWTLALGPLRNKVRINSHVELAALMGGSALSILLGKVLGQTSHFFLGDGIALLQITRMLRPLTRREKMASVLMACFHVAVACTIAPDVRFLMLALAALVLFPKSLIELQAEEFESAKPHLGIANFAALAVITMAIFITFPRFSMGGPLHLASGQASGPGLLSSVLDPSASGVANSAQVLMQVEGKNLRYFKCMALSQFDGREWRVDGHLSLRPFQRPRSEEDLASYPYRRVRVKNVNFLGRVLPTDGVPLALRGKFFNKPLLNTQGVIESVSSWNSANNQYEYWIDPNPEPEQLSAPLIRYYTQGPKASDRITDWLKNVTDGATNQLDVAHRLESYLRANYTYRLGAPALKRIDALEDFLIDKKEGHCERFASALALLLRMHNIPSRIAIGYVPGPKSRFSDWRQVRFKDAHSWTEAWFPETGWLSFDATPGGGGGVDGFGLTQWVESLDLLWYSHVITFDGASQREIISKVMGGIMEVPKLARRNLGVIFTAFALGFILWAFKRSKPATAARRKAVLSNADHFYAQLLRLLARQGWHKAPDQTPLEFLERLRDEQVGEIEAIEEITRAFCDSHYGQTPLSVEQEAELTALVARISACQNTLSPAASKKVQRFY